MILHEKLAVSGQMSSTSSICCYIFSKNESFRIQMNLFQGEVASKWSTFYEEASQIASGFDVNSISDPHIKLQIQSLQYKGTSVLSAEKQTKVSLKKQINSLYN